MDEKCPNSFLDVICKLGGRGVFFSLDSTEGPSGVKWDNLFLSSKLETEEELSAFSSTLHAAPCPHAAATHASVWEQH